MSRALAVLVLACLCAAEEPLELPRVGMIGDLPPEPRIVVDIAADGTLRLGGKELTLVELRAQLGAIGADRAMATNVVLRADSRLPWPAAFEVMSACVKARFFRVFWAVRPEEGDGEGGFATWCERPAFGLAGPGRQSVISVRGHVAASDASALHAALRKPSRKVHGVLVRGLPAASVSDVLRTCDAVCRAGIDGLSFVRFGEAPAPEPGSLVAKLEPAADGGPPALLLDLNPLLATDALLPARGVRKGFAGWATVGSTRKKPNACERGVELGLAWLAAHQSREDGRWDCDGFMGNDPADDRCDGPGRPAHDVAVTALALLAFLGAGYTDGILPGEESYSATVTRGLDYLVRVQDKDGCFGPRPDTGLYGHAIATLAMCEAQWRVRNPIYREPAQKGLDYLASVRHANSAWGNNTSLTAWCLCAVRSGTYAGLRVEDPDAFDGTRAWIEKRTDKETGRVSFDERYQTWRPKELFDRFPVEKSEAMTAAGIFCRVLLGEDPTTSPVTRKGSALCAARLPKWNPEDGSLDFYYWYWGTLALFQAGGRDWYAWEPAMKGAIVQHQHQTGEGSRTGSWDPIDVWGPEGGRVYSTALMTMCLEVYDRYDRVFAPK